MITKIIKRDGREAPFNIEKIAKAVFKAAEAAGGHDYNTAMDIACEVANQLEKNCGIDCKPTVEQIQDTVEKVLVKRGHARTAEGIHTLSRRAHQSPRDELEADEDL